MKATFKAIVASLLLAAPSAQAVVLDFEGFANGQIMDTEYLASEGVTISAVNNDNGAGVPDYAVIFDTTNPTHDPDLASPFYSSQADLDAETTSSPGPNPKYPGNVLILQENDIGCQPDGICDQPDDEGTRFISADIPTGTITFQFAQVIELLSIDFFDIENIENMQTNRNRIRLFDSFTGGNEIQANTYYTPDTGGDRLWDQVLFGANNQGVSGVRRIEVSFGGSGALDNIAYNVVPVPASVWLFGTALVGFIGFARRRSI